MVPRSNVVLLLLVSRSSCAPPGARAFVLLAGAIVCGVKAKIASRELNVKPH